MPRILELRSPADGRSLEAAVGAPVTHYDRDGDTVLYLIAQEHPFESIKDIVDTGRTVHREWLVHHCFRFSRGKNDVIACHTSIAATALYTWKLFRRDLGLSQDEVVAAVLELLNGLTSRK